jgi:CHAT domain-containing protein
MTVLAEYFCGREEVYLFIAGAHGGGLQVTRFPLQPLYEEIPAYLGRFLGESGGETGGALRSLVQPIVEHSVEDEVACIVPHGMLHYIPFHALPTSEGFLGFRNPVCYAPSASVLPVCRRATRLGGNPVVVAGDPTGDLKYARREAENVAEAFHGELLSGARATKKALYAALAKHEAVDILHLACHGRAGAKEAMQSGVVLAADPASDEPHGELLTAAEILRQKLHAGLVTVSACDAGLGHVAASDEVLGLTRALLYAGAASVLLSYWPLDDFSTYLVIERFYESLRHMIAEGAGEKATAVREAQQHVHDLTVRDVVARCDLTAAQCAARSDLQGHFDLLQKAAEWTNTVGDLKEALRRYLLLRTLAEASPAAFVGLGDRLQDQIEELEFRILLEPPTLNYELRPFSADRHWAGLFLHGDWKL